jgi:hypothetical protein
MRWIIGLFVVAIAGCIVLIAQPAPTEARLVCADCAALGFPVPVYVTTNEYAGIACRLPNNAIVHVVEEDGDYVRVKGISCTGWVRHDTARVVK